MNCEVSYVVDLSSKVDVISQKFHQLISMNTMPVNISFKHDICSVCKSHAFINSLPIFLSPF